MTKKWQHHGKFKTFPEAASQITALKTQGLWVKVRKRADRTFDVITWKDKDKDKE